MKYEYYFKQWCQETGRSGGILLGRSLHEFFVWLEKRIEEDEANDAKFNSQFKGL